MHCHASQSDALSVTKNIKTRLPPYKTGNPTFKLLYYIPLNIDMNQLETCIVSVMMPHEVKKNNETVSFVSLNELKNTINNCASMIANHICHCYYCKQKIKFNDVDMHNCTIGKLTYISPKPSKGSKLAKTSKSSKKGSKLAKTSNSYKKSSKLAKTSKSSKKGSKLAKLSKSSKKGSKLAKTSKSSKKSSKLAKLSKSSKKKI
jgi:hypothetical protein